MKFRSSAIALMIAALGTPLAHAGVIELSAGFFYNRTNYSLADYSWSKRLGFSIGYYFTESSQIEFSYQDMIERMFVTNYQDTTFHDRVYSFNWVQSILGKKTRFQPYVKIGVGQLNRDGSGTYAGGGAPPARYDAVTGVLGGGFKFYFTQTFALRTEATSYLAKGNLASWKDNIAASVGLSLLF
jgi:hypothetical protein